MGNRELFRWTFAASGLWLILTPFLLFGGHAPFPDAVVRDTGVLMLLGLLALIIASYSFSKHDQVRSFLGFTLGLAVVGAPWIAEFTGVIATWNAAIFGTMLVLVALYEIYQIKPELRTR